MVANSIIEIYTLLFAWDVYNGIWDVLTGTGLALIPFFLAILSSAKESLEGDAEDAVADLEVSMISMMLVLIFCVIPYGGFTNDLSSVAYTLDLPDCQVRNLPANEKNGTGDNVGGLYDTTFGDMATTTVRRPILWVVSQKISGGITQGAIRSMECVNNYALLLARIAENKITDPTLLTQIADFTEVCYLKAVDRFNENPVALPNGLHEVEKTDWIGSRIFLAYDNEYYQHPEAYMNNMEGYGFDRDEANRESDRNTPSGAHPYCDEVWLGEQNQIFAEDGLRTKILDSIDADDVGDILEDWRGWGSEAMSVGQLDDDSKDDLIVKLILSVQDVAPLSSLEVEQTPSKESMSPTSWQGIKQGISSGTGAIINNVTAIFEGLSLIAEKQKMRTLGPMVIALIQMVLIFVSPILMLVSGYSGKKFLAIIYTNFALEFIHAIWAAGFWFEQRLLDLYLSGAGLRGYIMNSSIVDNLGTATLFILPAIWLMLASKIGGSLIAVVGTTGAVGGMGGGGGGAGGSMIGKLVKKVASKGAA